MHPSFSLISMLAGVERFAVSDEAIKVRMVYFGEPSPKMNQSMQDTLVPLIEAGFHKPGAFEDYLEDTAKGSDTFQRSLLARFVPTTTPPEPDERAVVPPQKPVSACKEALLGRLVRWLGL